MAEKLTRAQSLAQVETLQAMHPDSVFTMDKYAALIVAIVRGHTPDGVDQETITPTWRCWNSGALATCW